MLGALRVLGVAAAMLTGVALATPATATAHSNEPLRTNAEVTAPTPEDTLQARKRFFGATNSDPVAHRRPAPRGSEVVDAPISISVVNRNGTDVPCIADGNRYAVRGRIVGPARKIRKPDLAVTLLVHGRGAPSRAIWHQDARPGYDTARALAATGHVVVTIDQVGWGESGIPHGNMLCDGSSADMLAQVMRKLRSGGYRLDGDPGIPVSRLALVGHSLGGLISQIAVRNFGGADSLAVVSYVSDPPAGGERDFATPLSTCARGGEPKRPGRASGYTHFIKDIAFDLWADADPAIVAAVEGAYERDPCAELLFVAPAAKIDGDRLASIDVPVLVLHGDRDPVASEAHGAAHAARFAPDAQHVVVRGAGHFLMLGSKAAEFRRALSDWLTTNAM